MTYHQKWIRWGTRPLFLIAAVVAAATVLYSFALNEGILRFPSEDPAKDGGEAFHVVELPGRGKGIIALRDIKVCSDIDLVIEQ